MKQKSNFFRNESKVSNKKINKLKIFNVACSVVFISSLLSSGVVYAANSNTIKADNIFQTDKVDIELQNNTKVLENGKETVKKLDDSKKIKLDPGDNLSIIPTITNNGANCYIRAYVNISGNSDVSISNLKGIDKNDWYYNYKDGYWYYKDILDSNESINLYNELQIPNDYDKENSEFDLKIDVDAIQSRNFEPDFKNDNPWGNVKIKKYIQTNVYQYEKTDSDSKKIDIIYNGDANKLITNQNDFFTNLPTLLPGDSYKNTINLYNSDSQNRTINLYFEGVPNITNKENDIANSLLKQISLKMTKSDGTVIFEGNLSEYIENQKILTLKPQETDQINFEIYFDKESDNAYTDLDNLVKWYFNTSYEVIDNGNNSGNNLNNGDNQNINTTPTNKVTKVKTSDITLSTIRSLIIISIISCFFVIISSIKLLYNKKKGNK